jgi:hypothetical protein
MTQKPGPKRRLRIVAPDEKLVHDCDIRGCAWRGFAPKPNTFVYGWIGMHEGARLVPEKDIEE